MPSFLVITVSDPISNVFQRPINKGLQSYLQAELGSKLHVL